ncbi:MAG: ABC transporter permease [Bacteroidetes bacterium]|nr:MAG: ABC transporter permease [Bacteroidota bacterium]
MVNVKLTPISGTLRHVATVKALSDDPEDYIITGGYEQFIAYDSHIGQNKIYKVVIQSKQIPNDLKNEKPLVALISYKPEKNKFYLNSIVSVNPWLTLPYVASLGELVRILNYHVPSAWIAVLAFLISMIFSIQYLRKRDIKYDIISSSAAEVGTVYTIFATVTGMFWAKFNWGSYWNWDPRETSIFVLLLIYGAYFALRSAIEKEDVKARLSAVYSILAFITVPFFVFVLPRITQSLHPGSASESNIGPVLSSQSDMLNTTKQYIFSLSMMSFTIIFLWILNLRIRIGNLRIKHTAEVS